VVFLSVLLFHASQTLQREVKRNVDGNAEEVMAKNGKGSFNTRNLLSAASEAPTKDFSLSSPRAI